MDASMYYALSWFFFVFGFSSWITAFAYCATRNEEHPFRYWLAFGVFLLLGASCHGVSKYFKMRYKTTPVEVYHCMGFEAYGTCKK